VVRKQKEVIAFPPHKWGAGGALSRFTNYLNIIPRSHLERPINSTA